MRIVFFEVMPGEHKSLAAQLPPDHEILFREEALIPETITLAAGAQIISVFAKSDIRQPVIDQLPDLKLITTRTMGVDHIDVAYAKSKGILVNNVQTYASHPVSEFTFALLLALARKIYPASHQLRQESRFDVHGFNGFNLFGKTLGVAGTGRIGKNVITIAQGFGMKVMAYDAFPDQEFAATQKFSYVPFNELLGGADIVTLHVPYTPETHHLIDAAAFGKMKKGVTIINTARGEIIDTHALLAALKAGTVSGAGLDVLENERDLKEELDIIIKEKPGVDYELLAANHILIDLPNVLVTPHIAFETTEAMQEIERVTAQTIIDFIAGKEQKYL